MWVCSKKLKSKRDSEGPVCSKKKVTKHLKNEILKKTALKNSSSDMASGFLQDYEEIFVRNSKDKNMNQVDKSLLSSGSGLPKRTVGDIDVEALNLNSPWRAASGSFKSSNVVDETTEHTVFNLNAFYNEMLMGLNSLHTTPVIGNAESHCEELEDYEKIDEYLDFEDLSSESDNDIAHKDIKDSIKKMEEELSEAVNIYKAQKAERIQVQNEMCKSISEDSNACVDRRSQLFLNLCHYQGTEKTNNTDTVKSADQGEQGGRKGNNNDYFIKRNIELAKKGSMATYALTDEQKSQLNEILSDIDEIEDSETDGKVHDNTQNNLKEEEGVTQVNAFKITNEDKKRLDEINQRLKNVAENEVCDEADEYKDMSTFCLENALKQIDKKLADLYKNFNKTSI
ncbi:uncharacterized protein LOC109609215 isoform X2 [Aethina tumida]|uniref:uncharacterized protein LOC109609215 isoform X2 n=1 Tax=Aethina tumida TaxID=116153 RepID=UPI002147B146|nr:uncharacterized protein LOC109609215 isoform X2 [Aethina tumida]